MAKLGKFIKAGTISIKIFYQIKKNNVGEDVLVVLEEDRAKELMENKEKVEILNTKWKKSTWKDQNEISENSVSFDEFGHAKYKYFAPQEMFVKKFLVEWDMTDDDGSQVPITQENIENLPPEIGRKLVEEYVGYHKVKDEQQEK